MAYNIPKGALVAHTVLVTLIDSLDDPSQRSTALKLVRESFDLGLRWTGVEDVLIRGAQAKILGEAIPAAEFDPIGKPVDRAVFETLAKAWLVWAKGEDPVPVLDLIPKTNEYGGALHLMALDYWGKALRALVNLEEGEGVERCFRRSMELGAQYGLETADAIQWTYAATILHLHRGT